MFKVKEITKILSSLLMLLVPILLVPLVIAIMGKEPMINYYAFIIPAILSLFLGLILHILTKKTIVKMKLTTSMLICALAWIMISLVGSMPFAIILKKSFIDSLFEAVSGFTTTGITVLSGLEEMPLSIIFFRSWIQWIGGLGILTFFLFVTFSSEGDIWQLFSAEGHKINASRPVPNVYKTVSILWLIYASLTIIETLLLYLIGVGLFDAVTHSMTTLSTGGFSRYDASIGYFKQAGYAYKSIEYIITCFMILGGMNFLIHYKVIFDSPKYLKEDVETKNYFKIIIIFSLIIGLSVILLNYNSNIEEVFRKSIFQVVSVMTTTGFSTEDINGPFFTQIAKQLFLILMVIGGSVGSTSGGIKVIRVTILSKLFKRELKQIYLPKRAVSPVVISQTKLSEKEIFRIAGLFFAWLTIIVVGAGITAVFSDLNAFQSFSGMASAVGNIGPFYFTVDKMASLSPIIKLTYIFGMLAGRLEIIPLFILFSKRAWMD